MAVIKLIIFTLVTWGIHLGIAGTYLRMFDSARSLGFRLLHSVEIAVLVTIMLVLVQTRLSTLATIATVLGTLLVADLILFGTFKSLRQQFDIWHFVIAYSVIALVISVVKNKL